jgi:hypothetical protein
MSYRKILAPAIAATLAVASLGALLSADFSSQATQAPKVSLDMDPAGNTYTPSVDADFNGIPESGNAMTVGTIENCLTSIPGNNAEHSHPVHVVIQDVEDLIGWQARINFDGTSVGPPANIDFDPFTDTTLGQDISFVNLPVDTIGGGHKSVFGAQDVLNPNAVNGTALFGSVSLGDWRFDTLPDVPEKSPHDETVRTYSVSGGGVLAALDFVTRAGQDGQPSLQLDLDDANPNLPGSKVDIFDGAGLQTIDLSADALGNGFHGEGATCEALPEPPTPTPSPTPEPTPTPGTPTPTPPPLQPGPERFNPQVSESYSDTSPGSHPDVTRTLTIGLGPDGQRNTADDTGDYNFAGIVSFSPSSPRDADIPDSAITGNLDANLVLGLVNSSCTTWIPAGFTFMEATTNLADTIEPLPYGFTNELSPLAGDLNQDGNPDIKPPPAVTQYPSYLNAIFDPDWVDFGPDRIAGNADDTNGPQPPIQPIARFAAATPIQTLHNMWVVIQEVVFEPGTKLPRLPAFDPALGYPSVTVLQQSSAAGSAAPPPSTAISDLCTPLDFNIQSYGVTRDNPDTPADEGGVSVRTLPAAGTTLTTTFFAFSQRDADGDGFENALDPCPFHADTVWDPRAHQPAGDTDEFAGSPLADGIPDVCDPTPTQATGGPPANHPTDHDGDGFLNRGDNCPLHSNPDQADGDVNAAGEIVGDGIGDVCDTAGTDAGTDSAGRPIPGPRTVAGNGPNVPDGDEIICVRTLSTSVGGTNEAQVSGCDAALPPGGAGGGGGTPSGCILDDNDFDNDGITNRRDRDDDNDGIRDGRDKDDDNDGIPDRWDPDDDNDGIPDRKDKDDGELFCPRRRR